MAAGQIVIDLLMKTGSFVTNSKVAESAVKGIGKSVEEMTIKLRAAGPAMAATMSASATSAMAYANQVVDVAIANDVAVGSIVQLSDALASSGGKSENAATLFAAFTKYLNQAAKGAKDAQESFTGIGVSLQKLSKMGADELFRETVAQIAAIEDPIKRNATAMAVFSEAVKGVDLVGLNNELKSTSKLSEEQEAGIAAAAAAWDKLSQAGRDFKLSVAEAIGPGMAAIIDFFNKLVGKDAMMTAFKTIFQAILIFASDVGFVIATMINDIKGLMEAAKAFAGKGGMEGAKAILKRTADEDRKRRDELDLTQQRIMGTAYKRSDVGLFRSPETSGVGRTIDVVKTGGKTPGGKTPAQILTQNQAADFEEAMRIDGLRQKQELSNLQQVEEARQLAHDEFMSRQTVEDAILSEKWDKENAAIQKGLMIYEQTRTPMEQLNERFTELNELLDAGVISWDTYARATLDAQDKFDQFSKKTEEESSTIKKIMEESGRAFTDFFANMLTGTKQASMSFSDMARSIVADLLKIQIQKRITDPLVNMGTSFLDGLFTGARADGGPVSQGSSYLVGERGPELFVPNSSGSIIPNNQLQGGGITINQSINVSTGVQQTVRAEIMNLMPQISNAAKSAVADAKMRGGSYAAAMR